jgi:hypothetical protein
MEKLPMLVVSIVVVYLLTGCQSNPPATPQAIPAAPQAGYARFLPYPQATGLALDTKTGLLCHTFNEAIDSVSKGGPETLLPGQHLLDSVPLCVDLSQNEEETVRRVRLADIGAIPDK